MHDMRAAVKQRLGDSRQRRRFWENVVMGPIAERLLEGKREAAMELLRDLLDNHDTDPRHGEVYLVGGGPGDPDLLTFRALRLMQQADVVVYDRLVAPAIVDLCRQDAKRIYVGKQRDQHTVPQSEINELLVRLAGEGQRVVRLKGGDPFIFGRGGEEIDTLAENRIPFQIVPGITAASGCAAYAGIPLTHRDFAQCCVFVTGHQKDDELDLPWQSLVAPNQTIAVYMGLHGLPTLSAKLIAHGLDGATPAAIIEHGTTQKQRVSETTVADLAATAEAAGHKAPSIIIIGEVVRLHKTLAWFPGAGEEIRSLQSG
jgi:uroporphyrin-III C-methyltransferase/precorrin-2 dehydrogenase/sirohydrochlorin ferrochelatase